MTRGVPDLQLPGVGAGWAKAGAAALVRDVILGGQDGLVNVLGLVLGLAVATGDTRIVITAALAATLAESIAMAGVAYTASGAERLAAVDHHTIVAAAVAAADDEAAAWRAELARWRTAMAPVRETDPVRAAAVVGVATILGSAVPLLPFLLLPAPVAPWTALAAATVVLAAAGAERARLTGGSPVRAALEMVVIGVASAVAGYLIGQLLRVPG
jgi:VIT1/CCC1 family predicted Fe2+/Mn2+ transporter